MQYMTTCHRISTELQVMIGSTSISPHTCTHTQHTWNTIHHLRLCCNYRPCSKLHRTGSLIGCAVTPVPLNLLNNTLTHPPTHIFFHINTATLFILKKESCGIGNATNHMQHIPQHIDRALQEQGLRYICDFWFCTKKVTQCTITQFLLLLVS